MWLKKRSKDKIALSSINPFSLTMNNVQNDSSPKNKSPSPNYSRNKINSLGSPRIISNNTSPNYSKVKQIENIEIPQNK